LERTFHAEPSTDSGETPNTPYRNSRRDSVSEATKGPDDQGEERLVSRRSFVAGAAGVAAAGVLPGDRATLREGVAPPPAIPRRPFGDTGAEICSVGLGAGSRFYNSIPDDESAAELVRRTIDMGIDFMETSANYGPDGVSEKRIGLAMKTHRSRVFLETKVDERTYDGAMYEMERSLERMNTDHLDLVLHHFLKAEDLAVVEGRNGAERALRRMIDEGVVRFCGFSTHLPDVALEGMERLGPHAIQLPMYFSPANATTPDRIEEYGPPPGAWDNWDIPTWTDYIHYALSLPIATATIGIDSYFTLEGIVNAAGTFAPMTPERMASVSERAQIFASTGYWIPRSG
jgi:hypothetical protein